MEREGFLSNYSVWVKENPQKICEAMIGNINVKSCFTLWNNGSFILVGLEWKQIRNYLSVSFNEMYPTFKSNFLNI